MATDIKLIWDDDLMEGDLNFVDNDLEQELGLYTAVLVSLFSDRRADPEDEIDNVNDKRGWWADLTTDGDVIGSKLWQIERAKTTKRTEIRAKEYILEALQWMIDDEVVANVEVITERQGEPGQDDLAIQIKIYKSDGNTVSFKFDNLWDAQMEVS